MFDRFFKKSTNLSPFNKKLEIEVGKKRFTNNIRLTAEIYNRPRVIP